MRRGCVAHLCASLDRAARGLTHLDVLHLDRVLAVAVGVVQLTHIHRGMLGVGRGCLDRKKNQIVMLKNKMFLQRTKEVSISVV